MTGLALANTIQEADERAHLAAQLEAETESMLSDDARRPDADGGEDVPPAQVRHDFPIPNPPDLRLHVLSDYNLEDIFGYINPQMLYVRHLGYKGRFAEDLAAGEQAAVDLRDSVRRVEDLVLARSDITANAVFKFFPCRSEGQWAADIFPGRLAGCWSGSTSDASRSATGCAWPITRCRYPVLHPGQGWGRPAWTTWECS